MEFVSEQGRERYQRLVSLAADVVVGVDFDGTLAPIVDDPGAARIHPVAPDVLARLAVVVGAVVVVTGRPARQVVELGGLEEIADALPPGARLDVMGQYGHERWDSVTRTFASPEPPEALQQLRAELPAILAQQQATDADVEEKGLALAVHTRRLSDPGAALTRLESALRAAAERHALQLEPGRMVLEVRAPGMHKGLAVRQVLAEHEGAGMLFIGDDLGDLEAFQALRELREEGLPALLVCSSSDEQDALAELADVVVDGPAGVVDLLRDFARDAGG